MDGVHVKVVSERAGHASVTTTLVKYSAYIPNMQQDAALRVDAGVRKALQELAHRIIRWEKGGESAVRRSGCPSKSLILF
jgi:hypothetical protein